MKANTAERLMIVRLTISQWYPRKFDKKASEEVAKAHGARSAKEVGRFNKILIDLAPMKALQSRLNKLRTDHYALTAPWSDDGIRVLPAELYLDYCNMVREAKQDIERLAGEFVNEYPALIEDAKKRLNGLFNKDDYPPAKDLRGKFGVEHHFEPLPNPEDVRVWGIGVEAQKEIAKDIEQQVRDSMLKAQQHVIGQVIEAAEHFVERVRNYHEGELKDVPVMQRLIFVSHVENLRDIVTLVLKGLNISGDQSVTKAARDIEKALTDVTADKLKNNAALREKTIKKVEAQLDKFKGVYG